MRDEGRGTRDEGRWVRGKIAPGAFALLLGSKVIGSKVKSSKVKSSKVRSSKVRSSVWQP